MLSNSPNYLPYRGIPLFKRPFSVLIQTVALFCFVQPFSTTLFAQECNVNGGVLSASTPTSNLCIKIGTPTQVQFTVSGNEGVGRFGIVDGSTGNITAVNTTGLFNMAQYASGNYLAGHISVESISTIAGVTNINQLSGCYDLSNTIAVSTYAIDGGTISANGPTTISGGSVSFSVSGNSGPNQRWVLLDELASQVLQINTTGTFNIDAYAEGAFLVVHIAYGPGVNLAQVNPQNPQGCIATSNTITIVKNNAPAYPPGTVFCAGTPTEIVEVINPVTSRIWMDRNLGAGQVATAFNDQASFGDLYQWGRFSDGHQCRNSSTTVTLSSSDTPNNGLFILRPTYPFDWRSPQNDNLWQGVNGINNPCPEGFRIPTEPEWNAERLSWSSNDRIGAFNSPLKLVAGGRRNGSNGNLLSAGALGFYWSSKSGFPFSQHLNITNSSAEVTFGGRVSGFSVRCTKDLYIETGLIDNLDCEGATITGDLAQGQVPSGVTYAVPYTGGNGGSHYAQTINSTGVTGLNANIDEGTFTNGNGELTYTIGGAAESTGTATFEINIGGQSCTFIINVMLGGGLGSYPPGTVHCSTPTVLVDVTNPITGKTWMDRNLGASQTANSSDDQLGYGDLYQWGRRADGHQCRTSPTTSVKSTSDVAPHGSFIVSPGNPFDWRTPQNDNLWQGVNGINNPCPTGYRIPSFAEWNAERTSWSSNNINGAFNSILKLTTAKSRHFSTGEIFDPGGPEGKYWSNSATELGANALGLSSFSGSAFISDQFRAYGSSVRCIKE